ncbi:MAG: hypothetical protein KDE27_29305 [Planctomycetes bacterium]|nr:hypothetical protein [Planctomycetota bacterium]
MVVRRNGTVAGAARPAGAHPRRAGVRSALNGARDLGGLALDYGKVRAEEVGLQARRWLLGLAVRLLAIALGALALAIAVVLTLLGAAGAVAAATGLPAWAGALAIGIAVFATAGLFFWLRVRRQDARVETLETSAAALERGMKASGRRVLRGLATERGLLVSAGLGFVGVLAVRVPAVRRVLALAITLARRDERLRALIRIRNPGRRRPAAASRAS